MSERNLRTLYEDLFLPQYYVSTYYFNIDAGNEFILRNLHTFFKDGKQTQCIIASIVVGY